MAMGLRTRVLQVRMCVGAGNAEAENIAQKVMLRLRQMCKEIHENSNLTNLAWIMAKKK